MAKRRKKCPVGSTLMCVPKGMKLVLDDALDGLGSVVRRSYTTQQRTVPNIYGEPSSIYDIVDSQGNIAEKDATTYWDAYNRAHALTEQNRRLYYDTRDEAARNERARERAREYVAQDDWDF